VAAAPLAEGDGGGEGDERAASDAAGLPGDVVPTGVLGVVSDDGAFATTDSGGSDGSAAGASGGAGRLAGSTAAVAGGETGVRRSHPVVSAATAAQAAIARRGTTLLSGSPDGPGPPDANRVVNAPAGRNRQAPPDRVRHG
jgi:hypothetical protein